MISRTENEVNEGVFASRAPQSSKTPYVAGPHLPAESFDDARLGLGQGVEEGIPKLGKDLTPTKNASAVSPYYQPTANPYRRCFVAEKGQRLWPLIIAVGRENFWTPSRCCGCSYFQTLTRTAREYWEGYRSTRTQGTSATLGTRGCSLGRPVVKIPGCGLVKKQSTTFLENPSPLCFLPRTQPNRGRPTEQAPRSLPGTSTLRAAGSPHIECPQWRSTGGSLFARPKHLLHSTQTARQPKKACAGTRTWGNRRATGRQVQSTKRKERRSTYLPSSALPPGPQPTGIPSPPDSRDLGPSTLDPRHRSSRRLAHLFADNGSEHGDTDCDVESIDLNESHLHRARLPIPTQARRTRRDRRAQELLRPPLPSSTSPTPTSAPAPARYQQRELWRPARRAAGSPARLHDASIYLNHRAIPQHAR